jgi:LmbE family N-acetylglucosaminyl deacetylase
MTRFATSIVLAALLAMGCNQSSTPPQENPRGAVKEKPQAQPSADAKGNRGGAVDLLVFGPHPNDEVIACAGIIRQALTAGKRVKIVLFTNGDGLPDFASSLARKPEAKLAPEDFLELARHRQLQSQASFDILGGKKQDMIFLGYPDSGLDKVYDAKGKQPFQQKFTQKSETYSAAHPDYHSAAHGRPSPYTYDAALADVVEVIRTLKPLQVYVTSEKDDHLDHQAAFRFVRDALKAAGHACDLFAYANHAGPEWPWPLGFTPNDRFEAHDVKGQQSPRGVPWPPTHRVPLPPAVVQLKLRAIQASMIPLAEGGQRRFEFRRQFFESFAKAEEVFWAADEK